MLNINDLSDELKLLIVAKFGPKARHDLFNLSNTCRQLRAFIAPTIFNEIRLANSKASSNSIQALANGPWKHCVNRVSYVGTAPWPPIDTVDIFPDSVHAVLSNLGKFTSLNEVVIEFRTEPGEDINTTAARDRNPYEADPYEHDCEALSPLMERSYEALSRNATSNQIKSIRLHNVLAHPISFWENAPWHALLRTLDRFALTLLGCPTNSTGFLYPIPGVADFMEQLPRTLFRHLTNVSEFSFKVNDLGLVNPLEATVLPLSKIQAPRLQRIHLSNIQINKTVSEFLVSHRYTLQSVILDDCWVAVQPTNDNVWAWHKLFEGVATQDFHALTNFTIQPQYKWIDLPRNFSPRNNDDFEPERVAFICVSMGLSLQMHWDASFMTNALVAGEDWRQYKRVQELVERNRG